MQITIGIRDTSAPLNLDINLSAEDLSCAIKKAVAEENVLELTGADGEHLIVPTSSLGYVKIVKEEQRRVGFGFM